MAETVFFLARETGWSEEQILAMPKERIQTYKDLVIDLYKKDE
jgi:hypothetical protein